MREYKHARLIAGILFIGGLIFSFFAFGKADFVLVFTLIIVFSIAGMFTGQEIVYDKLDKMHYTFFENEAKKRREKDDELSKKVQDSMKQYEKEHPETK
jgi:ATP-dependent protease Clp ATPase subunit